MDRSFFERVHIRNFVQIWYHVVPSRIQNFVEFARTFNHPGLGMRYDTYS